MFRWLVCAVLAGSAFIAGASQAAAQKKKVEITKKWSGSVENEKAIKPECITSAKGLEAVWKDWKIEGDVPKVDFYQGHGRGGLFRRQQAEPGRGQP